MVLAHSYEFSFAVAALVSSIQFMADPRIRAEAAIGSLGSTLGWFWTILYLVGAIGIIAGMLRPDDRWELAGLSSFCAAALVNAAALLQARGTSAIYVTLIYLSFIAGSAARLHLLLALRRIGPVPSSTSRKG